MDAIEREAMSANEKAEHAEKRARNGFGMGLAGVLTGGAALLSQWSRGGGLFGGNDMPSNVNINNNGATGNPSPFDVYSHECQDILNLTNEMWGLKMNTMTQATAAREVDVAEKFGLYKSQVDGDFGNYKAIRDLYDSTNERMNNAVFGLYRGQRDLYDNMQEKFCGLAQEIAVLKAIQPYQNKLTLAEIERAHTDSINYTDRRTCRMLTGIVTLPNDPTVTGYPSACACNSNFSGA